VAKEAHALSAAGWSVDVICLRGPGETAFETLDNIHIHRIGITHRRGSKLRYMLEYGGSMLHMALLLTRCRLKKRFRVIQVNTMPDALVFITLLPRLLGARILLDLHEPMPELYRSKYGDHASHFMIRLQTCLEQWAIRYAHHAITVNDTIRNRFIERGAAPEKISVVRNVPDDAFGRDARREPRQQKEFLLMTHGTLQPRYGHDVLLQALPAIRKAIPQARLRIVGDGETGPRLRQIAKETGIAEAVTFTGKIPRGQIARTIAQADIGLVPLMPCPFSELCQPNKLFEYVAVRVPVVAARFPAIRETFSEECLTFFEAGNPDDLARCVIDLYHAPERRKQTATRAFEVYQQVRWAKEKERYLHIIGQLLHETVKEKNVQ
jgi:glycosyltransferase involved in cell wall biosynthesis